jgi:leucyl aminopeptidase
MTVSFHAVRSVPKAARVAATIVTSEEVSAGIDDVASGQLEGDGFAGERGQVHTWPEGGRTRALVGVGSAGDLDAGAVRAAGAAIARAHARHSRVGVELPDTELDPLAVRQALVEGIVLGGYSYREYKTEPTTTKLARVDVAGSTGTRAQGALDTGAAVAAGQCLARDLVNEPGGSLTAPALARKAAAIARDKGMRVKVWTEAEIKKGRLGGLIGVNRGSSQPPRFVELTYQPKGRARGTLALVGKGLTFDSGGLSIKTSQGMMTMKSDMSGAAAVIGAMSVLPEIAPTSRVRGFLPMTDNMSGGDATRPGDVFRIRNGKTIEVLNTDAEGRLVLADALSVASDSRPDAIVDLATLTGACVVALGPRIAGLMGNNEGWMDQVEGAATAAGERVWRLPLPADYRDQFESTVADLKNIGGSQGGGALTAGLILQEFVAEGIPWAHLDIAGPAFSDTDDGEVTKGGTGFGVRLLIELAKRFEPLG